MVMANLHLLNTTNNFRTFSISATSNGAPFSSSSTSKSKGPVIIEIPLDKIRRPLMRTRSNDPEKVQALMDSIRVIGLQEPVSTNIQLMSSRLKENIMVSQVVIVMKLTNASDSPKFVVKFGVEQKKLLGITCAEGYRCPVVLLISLVTAIGNIFTLQVFHESQHFPSQWFNTFCQTLETSGRSMTQSARAFPNEPPLSQVSVRRCQVLGIRDHSNPD
ncbi:hypothetical protein IFM89_015173 [Coptis chinensis]|uniref:Uncharacterized protein n=1 Tax=Coptis chinensis TaxID=261450 RepID=A0A835GWB3_9MAGN|nr:hypothetical protein IFM89_015173 [Coptis chinensis]